MRPQTYDQRFVVHFQRVVLSRFQPKAECFRLDQLVAIQPKITAKINCRQFEDIAPIDTKDGELFSFKEEQVRSRREPFQTMKDLQI
jgi:hypothetical protein